MRMSFLKEVQLEITIKKNIKLQISELEEKKVTIQSEIEELLGK